MNYIFFWNVGLCGASGIVFAFIILASFTGFKATFTNMEITECKWLAHDGQVPDVE